MALRAETTCPTAADHVQPAPTGAEFDAAPAAAPRFGRPEDEALPPRFVDWDDEDEEEDEEFEDEEIEFGEDEDEDDDYEEEEDDDDDEFFVEDDDEEDEEIEYSEEDGRG